MSENSRGLNKKSSDNNYLDSSCYATYMRMAKPFAMRYPLEESQGNTGTIITTGDEAAMRYTELRLAKPAKYLYGGLEKNTIERWNDNFDDTEKFPSVFPSIGWYNIVNGTTGIGVSISSSIPQFNLREVNDAIIKLIQNPNVSFDEIVCYPDFATGATLINKSEVKESLRNGTGKACKLRAVMKYNPDDNTIVVTQIPYGVYTSTITEQIKKLLDEDPNYGIENIIDGSSDVVNYTIYLSKGVNPKKMMNKLYHDTSLEYFFGINMTMLDNGRFPRVFGWKDALTAYITHASECKRKEYQYDLTKLLARQEILTGLLMAIAYIEEVVNIIKASKGSAEATTALINRFGFTPNQVKAILDLKLQRLTNLEGFKIEQELSENKHQADFINSILNNQALFNDELIKIFREVSDQFGDDRRTALIDFVEEEKPVDIPEKDVNVIVFKNGSIIVTPSSELSGARRGRKGTTIKSGKDTVITDTITTTNFGQIGVIASSGKISGIDVSKLDLDFEYSIYDLVKLADNEEIIRIVDMTQMSYYKWILFVTRGGFIKKTECSEYAHIGKGTIAIKLRENDRVVNCFFSNDEMDQVLSVTNTGFGVLFTHESVRCSGKNTMGVKSNAIKDEEYIAAADILHTSIEYAGFLTVSNTGRGKITELPEFPLAKRASRGLSVMSLDEGEAIGNIMAIPHDTKRVNMFAGSKMTTMAMNEIPVSHRATLGVRLIDARGRNEKIHITINR